MESIIRGKMAKKFCLDILGPRWRLCLKYSLSFSLSFSLCIPILFIKPKDLSFICDVYVLWGKGSSIRLSFCIQFSFVIMSFFLFPILFFFSFTIISTLILYFVFLSHKIPTKLKYPFHHVLFSINDILNHGKILRNKMTTI